MHLVLMTIIKSLLHSKCWFYYIGLLQEKQSKQKRNLSPLNATIV